jgi:predicted RNA-binding Zn ribbon-like protein
MNIQCGLHLADKFQFQLFGGHVALDFANTLDFRYDPERFIDLLSSYERLLAFFQQTGIITAKHVRKLLANTSESEARRTLRRAIELRETIYFLFLSVLSGRRARSAYLRAFNRFLEDARVPEKVTWQKRSLVRTYRDFAGTAGGPLWAVVDAAANLLTSPDCLRMRECSEKTCRWLFLDQSKNHSRRWCDMKLCGNRAKARRFYARLRGRA